MKKKAEGIAWFKDNEDYDKIRSILNDSSTMPENYNDWQAMAKEKAEKISKEGLIPIIAEIDPDSFSDWCTICGFSMDTRTLDKYAALEVTRFLNDVGYN